MLNFLRSLRGPAAPEQKRSRVGPLIALHEAGRPLHAGEILQGLTALGFDLPGHDPVAALNTRLWKRAVPGGPLKRLGEAVYAPADEDEDLG